MYHILIKTENVNVCLGIKLIFNNNTVYHAIKLTPIVIFAKVTNVEVAIQAFIWIMENAIYVV
jgi:hypothetical protein